MKDAPRYPAPPRWYRHALCWSYLAAHPDLRDLFARLQIEGRVLHPYRFVRKARPRTPRRAQS